jgi:hypothetical protein
MGWETKDDDVRRTAEEEGDSNHPRAVCSHDWRETSRESLGYDGGDYHDGRGEMWYEVVEVCQKCGERRTTKST